MGTAGCDRRLKLYNRHSIQDSPHWGRVPAELRLATKVVSRVLPFRTNEYVLSELIDWERVPDDPIFRLTFPHPDMLHPEEYGRLQALVSAGHEEGVVAQGADAVDDLAQLGLVRRPRASRVLVPVPRSCRDSPCTSPSSARLAADGRDQGKWRM